MAAPIPVIVFAYARPAHLAQLLACLKRDAVPLIYAFADGAKGTDDAEAVAKTRQILRQVDWCELRLTERARNVGLGRNVLAGVSEVAAKHDAFIVWEDDLVCVPGAYAWLGAALRRYADDPRVLSVAAWNHPRVTPADAGPRPYFDGRAECWGWGAFARSWQGMDQTALEKMAAVRAEGVATDAYGADLPEAAQAETTGNIWAVRWLYHHLQHKGLCLRPPWTMVEHEGFDSMATNSATDTGWSNSSLPHVPAIPEPWPEPRLHPECAGLWRRAFPGPWRRRLGAVLQRSKRYLRG